MNRASEFQEELLRKYQLCGHATGYWGRRFRREVDRKGGLETAKRMLQPRRNEKVAEGFQSLIDVGRIELSVEATVMDPRFTELFTENELAEAARRLAAIPGYAIRRPTPPDSNYPDELTDDAEYAEGARRSTVVNAYERDPRARAACIQKYGLKCAVCEMSFLKRYGEIGRRFIHVHHKKPLAARRAEYKVRPTLDLVPVCPNCHAMLHTKNPPLGIDELRDIYRLNNTP